MENNRENSQNGKNIRERIVLAAKSGKLKMRPKWHFVLRSALWAAGIGVMALAALYFASLFLFINRETGIWLAPIFGWQGIIVFLMSLPWMIIVLVLIFTLILEILVSRYGFAYRLPLLYSALALLLAVFAGAIMVAQTSLHEKLSRCPRTDRPIDDARFAPNNTPCGKGVYRDLGPRRFNDFHYGKIGEINDKNLIITTRHREDLIVEISPRTRLPFGAQFEVGDELAVVGKRNGDHVEAFGIIQINH